MNVGIYTVYTSNINELIPKYQKNIFNKFGLNINQTCINVNSSELDYNIHPNFLMDVINTSPHDYIIFFDIDCIPLSGEFYDKILNDVKDNNTLSGIIQAANHLNPKKTYVGPGFCGFYKQLYTDCGSPDFKQDHNIKCDVMQSFTDKCLLHNKSIQYWNVTDSGDAIWDILPINKKFGHGTTYENLIYHQFEIRFEHQHNQFINKCEDVLSR